MTDKLDIEDLLSPIDDEAPCGEGLDEFVFDPEFAELERLAQGKEEQVMGDEVIPAEEPDWRAVREKSLELFKRVNSLRVAVHLCRALTMREGLGGLRFGLELILEMLKRYWDETEPLIEDGDATERLHTLAEISSPQGLMTNVKHCLLVSSQAIGRYTIRDFLVATEKLKPGEDQEPTSLTSINQALMDCELDDLKQLMQDIDALAELGESIEQKFNENVSAEQMVDLGPFTKLMTEIRPTVQEALGRRGVASEAASGGDGAEAQSQPAAAVSGEIRSREDVVRMLDRITEYYNRHEPSSPVPLLVQRAKRLVSADFMAIIKDVASDGAQQADLLLGGESEET